MTGVVYTTQGDRMSNSLKIDSYGEVAIFTLNRPEVRNALNTEVVQELLNALQKSEHDDAVRSIVLTGTPPGFSSGGDLSDLSGSTDPSARAVRHRIFVQLAHRIIRFPKPIVAAVNGLAVGAGAAIALACDYVIVAEGAQLSFPFVSIGLPPDLLTASQVTRRSGTTVARDLIYSGRRVASSEAVELHLVDRKCADEELHEQAVKEAQRLGSLSPFAFSLAKDSLRNAYTFGDAEIDVEPLAVAVALSSNDFRIATERFRK